MVQSEKTGVADLGNCNRSTLLSHSGFVRRTLDAAQARYTREPAAAAALLAVGSLPAPAGTPAPELAAWTLVASQVLNLDESLCK